MPWQVPLRLRKNEFIGNWVQHGGVFDAPVTEAILRLLESGETAVDVGAHIGHMTSAMARACAYR